MINTTVLAALLALAPFSPCFAAPLAVCPVTNGQVVNYDIIRSGTVIGHETLKFALNGADMTVTVDANAGVRMLGIRVYRYEHHSEEHWHSGQLVGLVSRTDDDGTPRHVDASRDQNGVWTGISGLQPGPAPLLPTSLWNVQSVTQTRMLDRETGEVVPVHTAAGGQAPFRTGSRDVAASKFDMTGIVSGTTWYDSSGCWIAARFNTRVDHSVIEVRLE